MTPALGVLQVRSHAFPRVHQGSAQPHITWPQTPWFPTLAAPASTMQGFYTGFSAASLHEGHRPGFSLLGCEMGWCVLALEPGCPVTSHCVMVPMAGRVPGKRIGGEGAGATSKHTWTHRPKVPGPCPTRLSLNNRCRGSRRLTHCRGSPAGDRGLATGHRGVGPPPCLLCDPRS